MRPSCGSRRSAIELRHDLDARDNGVGQVPRRGDHLVKHAVRLHADLELVFKGFEVNIARLILDGEKQDHVEELADRGRVGDFGFRREIVAVPEVVVVIAFEAGDDRLDALFLVGVIATDGGFDILDVRDGAADFHADEVAQVVQGADVLRIGHGDGEDIVLEADRHHLVQLGHGHGDELEGLRRDGGLAEIDDRHAPLLGEGFGHLGFGDHAHADGDLADDLARALLLLFQHVPELILGEVAQVDQNLSELALCHGGEHRVRGWGRLSG